MTEHRTTLGGALTDLEVANIYETLRECKAAIADIPDDISPAALLKICPMIVDHGFKVRGAIETAFNAANKRDFQPAKPFVRGPNPTSKFVATDKDLKALGLVKDAEITDEDILAVLKDLKK